MTDFFKHGNKVYIENLNDGIIIGNSFDWTVNISLPGDTGGVFPNSTTVVKAKVADVYATPNSNLSIGSTIENSSGSSQVYRLTVYPSFNRFGGFTFVSLEGDGSVIITEKGGTSPVRNNIDYTNLGNVTELKTLKEYDIVVTIPSGGEVTGLGFGFKSSSADVTASINQSNVTGLEDTLTEQEGRLSTLEEVNSDIYYYNLMSSDFNPNIDDEIIITCRVKTVTGEDVEGKTVTLYKNGSSVGTSTTSELGVASWTVTCDDWGLQDFRVANTSIQVNVTGWKQIGRYASDKITLYSDGRWGMVVISGIFSGSTTGEVVLATINSGYSPFSNVSTNSSYSTNSYQAVYTSGTNICVNRIGTGSYGVYCTLYFRLATPKY